MLVSSRISKSALCQIASFDLVLIMHVVKIDMECAQPGM